MQSQVAAAAATAAPLTIWSVVAKIGSWKGMKMNIVMLMLIIVMITARIEQAAVGVLTVVLAAVAVVCYTQAKMYDKRG